MKFKYVTKPPLHYIISQIDHYRQETEITINHHETSDAKRESFSKHKMKNQSTLDKDTDLGNINLKSIRADHFQSRVDYEGGVETDPKFTYSMTYKHICECE